MPKAKGNVGRHNKELLKEIRDNFEYQSQMWQDIRDEGKKDMRYVAGDPWDPREKAARMQSGQERPCLVFDELSQYLNQLNNDVRQNKRAIRVIPVGAGANDQTAELKQGIIRQIEYKSNAQSAYSTGFENATSRSYGYWRIGLKYTGHTSFDREPVIRRISNPDSVYLDWNARETDYSDGEHAFVVDQMDLKKFKKNWPNATPIDFASDDCKIAPDWIVDEKRIQIAEYWKVIKKQRTLVLLDDGTDDGALAYLDGKEDERSKIPTLPKGTEIKMRRGKEFCYLPPGFAIREGILVQGKEYQGLRYAVEEQRKTETRRVVQYLTNGVEILEENEWAGRWIPIIPVFGKELWVDKGRGPERVLMSLIRLARDPYMLYCWLRSNEMEEAGMTPKVPWIMAKGQIEGCEGWEDANRVPRSHLEYNVVVEGMAAGATPLPPPERQPFTPNFGPYEIVTESTKRAIQSAMGRYNASVGKDDTNAKSGVAIKALDQQSDQGSFHFIDNYNQALEYTGRQLLDLTENVIDRPRDIGIRKPDESFQKVRVNDPLGINPKTGETWGPHTDLSVGEHDVTVSTGPSFQSQRDQVNNFLQTLAGIPELFKMVPDLVVKYQDLGPIGEEIAERLVPPQFASQEGQVPLPVQVAQAKQQATQLNAAAQHLQQQVSEMTQEKQAKVVENNYRLQIAQMETDAKMTLERERMANDLLKAEILSKEQEAQLRKKWEQEQWLTLHGAAHDAASQAVEQQHEQQMAQQEQQAATQQQESAQAADAAAAQPTPAGPAGAPPAAPSSPTLPA